MSRTEGSTNIKSFNERDEIPLARNSELKFFRSEESPLERFKKTVKHQEKFLNWLQQRHDKIILLTEELEQTRSGKSPARPGAKDRTHRKYMWYSERMALLDVINAFEYFYKDTVVELATILSDIIPSSQITGNVEGRFLWEAQLGYSLPRLLFEHRLFHNLDEVDSATKMLVEGRCYDKQRQSEERRCIQAIFQIRHTLSHNCGELTTSDSQKFNAIGLNVIPDGVIDPGKDNFSKSVYRYLTKEAKRFTECLRDKTIDYLSSHKRNSNTTLANISKSKLEKMFGKHSGFDNLDLNTVI